TLIINRADKFGLTQLYQLRGRVGRGAELAYAYFLYDREKRLTPTAERRLRTIFEATELGAGFNIAMKDLEIRGAGSLLGVKQSGHISTVGFNLYTQLLGQAVEELKSRPAGEAEKAIQIPRLPEPTIDLPLRAYIPDDYVSDMHTRLVMYQNFSTITEVEQIEELVQEFRDRFGSMPGEVENLLYALRIKILATKAHVESIATDNGQILVRLFEGLRFDQDKLQPILRAGINVGTNQLRLNPKRLGSAWRGVLEELLEKVG
ncbi:TRCF domain-containing protein, partial [Chloroflexota bacterium]